MDTEPLWGWGLGLLPSFPSATLQKVHNGSPSHGLGLHPASDKRAGEGVPFLLGSRPCSCPHHLCYQPIGLKLVIWPHAAVGVHGTWDGHEPDKNSEVLLSKEKENINLGDKA